MKRQFKLICKILIVFFLIIPFSSFTRKKKVEPDKIQNLLCFWEFSEKEGENRISKAGKYRYDLLEGNNKITKVKDGVFGKFVAELKEGDWFYIPRAECSGLNIHGKNAQVTVVAWIKRGKKNFSQCEAVAGIWNETNRQRQYCLFLDLRIWKSSQQVGGHISGTGGPTEGYKYCMDASIGKTPVQLDQWQCVGFTYDGIKAYSYLNGKIDEREGRNPYPYDLGLFDGGLDGADFTVGAVHRSGEMGNFFVGRIGGLAIYDRALTEEEMAYLASNIEGNKYLNKKSFRNK